MVEQADAGESHRDAILVASLDYMVVAHAATGLCHELHAALCARSMLSPKGKNASDPKATPVFCAIQACFSSRVSGSAFQRRISAILRQPTRPYSRR